MLNNEIIIDHVNLTVRNLEESLDWYKRVFQFEPVERGVYSEGFPWAIIRNGKQMLALSQRPLEAVDRRKRYHGILHFGIRLKDRKEWEATVESQNVNVDHTFDYPNSTSWYILDPTGHEIEVSVWNNDQLKF